MNKRDFLWELKKHTPPHLKGEPFSQYSKIIEKQGRETFYNNDFHEAIKLMESIKISFSQKGKSDSSELTPQDIITSDFLLDKIDPWVEQVRKNLFGSSELPFDWDGAINWIEKEVKKPIKNKDDIKTDKVKELREQLRKELAKRYIYLSERRYLLPYIKKDSEWVQNVAAIGPRLFLLEYETRKMEEATGFNQASLVMYVLSGITPLLSRYRISTSFHAHTILNKEQILWKEVELKFRSRDLKFEELLGIYNQIKKSLTIKREISLKEKSVRINKLVKELGLPPRGIRGERNKKYWEKTKDLWNDRYPNEQYNDWRAIAQQYDRITIFLERTQILNKSSF